MIVNFRDDFLPKKLFDRFKSYYLPYASALDVARALTVAKWHAVGPAIACTVPLHPSRSNNGLALLIAFEEKEKSQVFGWKGPVKVDFDQNLIRVTIEGSVKEFKISEDGIDIDIIRIR